LSKYIGPKTKDIDMMILELGLYYVAEQNYYNLDHKDKRLVDHYSEGINSCVDNR